MKRTTKLALTIAIASVLGMTGCSKKKLPPQDTGETAGLPTPTPGPDRIDEEPTPTTPTISDSDLDSVDIAQKNLRDIYFDFDSYELRADQRATLEANASWLMANTSYKVIIEGHCDERGTDEYNLALGDRRANAARSYLQHLGVATERLSTISYGEAYPVDPGHHESAWSKNRRAHFGVVPPKGR